MLVAGASACAQSIFGTNRRNPAFRILFNAAALVLTVQAAGMTFTYFGGQPGELDFQSIAKPLVASALAYYLVNTFIVATAVGLAARQRVWTCLADELPVDRAQLLRRRRRRGGGWRLWTTSQWWLLPLAAAPVYLTFRSYRMYVDRIASEKRHKEEVLRLHGDTVAALEAARRSEQRYALAAAGSNDGLWDWDIPANALYCSDRWKLMIGLSADASVSTHEQWLEYAHDEDRPGLVEALRRPPGWRARALRARVSRAPRARRDPLGAVPRHRGPRRRRPPGPHGRLADRHHRAAPGPRHAGPGRAPRPVDGPPEPHAVQRAAAAGDRAGRALVVAPATRCCSSTSTASSWSTTASATSSATGSWSRSRSGCSRSCGPATSLARLGGDEFAVLVENFSTPEDVCAIAERLQRRARASRSASPTTSSSGRPASASSSAAPQYRAVDAVLRDADIAMYRAKAAGRGGYEMFDPHMHAAALARLTLETELRHAVERKEFSVFYQPIVELPSSRIIGLEALRPLEAARWPHRLARRVHRRRRGNRAHRPAHLARAGRSLPPGRGVAADVRPAAAAVGQHLVEAVHARQTSWTKSRRRWRAAVCCRAQLQLEITERRCSSTIPTSSHENFERLRGIRRRRAPRRLRHRLLVAQLPAALPGGCAEARSLVRRADGHARERRASAAPS